MDSPDAEEEAWRAQRQALADLQGDVPEIERIATVWRTEKRVFKTGIEGHVCSPFCGFECIVRDEWFGCLTSGALHHCGDACDRQVLTEEATYTCSLTGRTLGVLLADEWCDRIGSVPLPVTSRNEVAKNVGLRKKNPYKVEKSSVVERHGGVRGIVYDALRRLLSNEKEAEEYNRRYMRAQPTIRKGCIRYGLQRVQNCVRPNMHVIRRIAQGMIVDSRLYARTVCNKEQLENYVDVTCEFWKRLEPYITKTKRDKNHIEEFSVGFLYLLQHGISDAGFSFPSDPWLMLNLPAIPSLKKLHFKKGIVTAGRNGIAKAMSKMMHGLPNKI